MNVLRTVLLMVLGIAVPLAFQLWDKRRLDAEARERAWNFASWACALYAFGPLSMLGWFVVTRRGLARLLGLVVTAGMLLLLALIDAALGWALGLEMAQ